jgi:hypothetical protein
VQQLRASKRRERPPPDRFSGPTVDGYNRARSEDRCEQATTNRKRIGSEGCRGEHAKADARQLPAPDHQLSNITPSPGVNKR